jgi:hypothetical protein
MKKENFRNYTDLQIIEYFHDASIRRAQCGFNVTPANRICEREMGPAYGALAARGEASLREFLSLTDDPNPNVRKDAAIFAFDVDPDRCRRVLEKLIGEPGWVGAAAMLWLLHKSPEFAAEFSRIAKLRHERFLRERDRRYPRSNKDE